MQKLLCFVVVGLMSAAVGSAQIVFDNFGPNDDYETGVGWTLSDGQPIGADYDQGDAFVPSQSGNLAYVEVAIGLVTGSDPVTLWLMDDNNGQPGNILETLTGNYTGQFGNPNPPIHIDSQSNPFLDSSQQYWLIASTARDTWAAWNLNNTGDVGPHAFRQDMGAWSVGNNTRGAFRVAIPEPGTLGLLAVGLLGLLRRR